MTWTRQLLLHYQPASSGIDDRVDARPALVVAPKSFARRSYREFTEARMDCDVLLWPDAVVPPEALAGSSSHRITEYLVRGAMITMPPPVPDTVDNRRLLTASHALNWTRPASYDSAAWTGAAAGIDISAAKNNVGRWRCINRNMFAMSLISHPQPI